ncbi:MAG: AAA family ATPase [Burkholderiaceae bacterium]|nr:AAA family ATPase [Burkholderiaceae bacterium]
MTAAEALLRPPAPSPPAPALEAEQALLGALLVRNDLLDRMPPTLRPEHFADGAHAELFAAITALVGQGRTADAVTLAARTGELPALAAVGGAKYLADLIAGSVSLIAAADYGAVVLENWRQRTLFAALADALERLAAPDAGGAAALIEALEERLFALAADAPESAEIPAAEAARRALEAARRSCDGLLGVPSGLAGLDRICGGFQPGNLYVIGARPGMGKTALAVTVACRAAAAGHPVLIVSLEMSAAALAARMVAAQAAVPLSVALQAGRFVQDNLGRWRFRPMTHDDSRLLDAAVQDLARLNLAIDFVPDLTVAGLRARVRRRRRRSGCALVVIDYLGLMRASDRAQRMHSRVQEIAEISRDLKVMAGELAVPVLLLSQLNREAEKREHGRPWLSDLRDSGAVEQDAELVGLLHREHETLKRNEPRRGAKESEAAFAARCGEHDAALAETRQKAKLFVEKNRQGQQIALELRWHPDSPFFSDPREAEPARLFSTSVLAD